MYFVQYILLYVHSCASNNQFQIGNKKYYYSELGCLDEDLGKVDRDDGTDTREAKETADKCGPGLVGQIYKVEVNTKLLYESCFDKTSLQTVWTRHRLYKFNRETHCSRPDVKFTAKGLPAHDFQDGYKQVLQS